MNLLIQLKIYTRVALENERLIIDCFKSLRNKRYCSWECIELFLKFNTVLIRYEGGQFEDS